MLGDVLRFDIMESMIKQILFGGKVEVGISEIGDGNMRFFGGDEGEIIRNQGKLGEAVALGGDRVARVRTIYDGREGFTDYAEITEGNVMEYSISNFERRIPVSDGLVTRCVDVGILLPLADCLGMVVFDEERGVVGLLHSGRQNVEQGGPRKFIEYFVENFGSEAGRLKVYFSPHATGYRVFGLGGKTLSEAAVEQIVGAGVLPGNIVDSRIDTVSSSEFPSYSSGDKTERFAVVVRRTE